MQKCKIGYNKRTKECCSIENCKYKVEHIDKKRSNKDSKKNKRRM